MSLDRSDEFDQWYVEAITFAPGSTIKLQELVDAFRRTLDPSQRRHWPFTRALHRLKGSIGRWEPHAPLHVANVWWSRPPITIGENGLFQEAAE